MSPPCGPCSRPSVEFRRAELIDTLFQEHNTALIAFLLARVSSEQEARDVAQEAYVKMLELDQPAAVSFHRAYLFKIAANLATDRARQRATHTRLHERWSPPTGVAAPSPENVTSARQELALISSFLHELPEKCREAFFLYRLHEQTADQIAVRLGVTKRMVWKYIFRALEHCKQRLNATQGTIEPQP